MRPRAAASLLLLLLLAACGTQTGGPRAEDPSNPAGADGVSYLANGLPGWAQGVDRLQLDLSRDELRFTAGCNQFSGPVTWEADGPFAAGPLAGTEMGCAQRAVDVDAKLADFFQRADHLERDGTDIRISAGDRGIWFVPASELPDEQPAAVDLEGTTWRLTGIGEYDGDVGSMMEVPKDSSLTLVVSGADIQFGTGCNTGSGHVSIEGDELVLSDVATTTLPCPRGPVDLESGVLAGLGGGRVTWSINDKHLTLLSANHKHQLDYEAE